MIEICLVYCLSSGQFVVIVVIGRMEQLANQMILGELMANWLN